MAERDGTPIAGTRLPPHRPLPLTVGLGAVIVASIVGTICSIVPSMAFRPEGGTVEYEYGLSVLVAPALFAVIVVVAARALRPSRKRLHAAAGTLLGVSPLLILIRVAREPWLDIDDEYVTLAPWVIHTFVACAVVLFGIGVAVLSYAQTLEPDPGADFAAARARIRED